jgi:hypothetical protein
VFATPPIAGKNQGVSPTRTCSTKFRHSAMSDLRTEAFHPSGTSSQQSKILEEVDMAEHDQTIAITYNISTTAERARLTF